MTQEFFLKHSVLSGKQEKDNVTAYCTGLGLPSPVLMYVVISVANPKYT